MYLVSLALSPTAILAAKNWKKSKSGDPLAEVILQQDRNLKVTPAADETTAVTTLRFVRAVGKSQIVEAFSDAFKGMYVSSLLVRMLSPLPHSPPSPSATLHPSVNGRLMIGLLQNCMSYLICPSSLKSPLFPLHTSMHSGVDAAAVTAFKEALSGAIPGDAGLKIGDEFKYVTRLPYPHFCFFTPSLPFVLLTILPLPASSGPNRVD